FMQDGICVVDQNRLGVSANFADEAVQDGLKAVRRRESPCPEQVQPPAVEIVRLSEHGIEGAARRARQPDLVQNASERGGASSPSVSVHPGRAGFAGSACFARIVASPAAASGLMNSSIVKLSPGPSAKSAWFAICSTAFGLRKAKPVSNRPAAPLSASSLAFT